jgi:signal peptidase II
LTWSPRGRVFWPILVTLLIADCTTKRLADIYLVPEHTPHSVAGSVVRFTLTHNSGAAMNMSLGRHSRIAFSIAAAFALVLLVQLYRATPATDRLRAVSLALLVGGATGNLVNRLISSRGVIDFIDIGVPSWRFWTFNVADAGITIGAVLLAYVLWRETRQARRPELTRIT